MDTETPKILVVDDDSAICNLITRFLAQKNYEMKYAYDGRSALAVFEKFSPDLVILDVNLPDTLGYNLCEEMQNRRSVFVLMLTSRNDAADKKKGFIKGADDYLTKPFDLEELEYRIKAILRRNRPLSSSKKPKLAFKNLAIDNIRREVTVNGKLVNLTALEFDILFFLASNVGQVCSRFELLEKVWNYGDSVGDQRVVDVHIGQIRKKLDLYCTESSYIQTIRSVGYKFEEPK